MTALTLTPRRRCALLLLALAGLYLTWTFDHSLWNPDETRDGGIAAEMFRSRDFAVPKLNGEAFLEKPPLYYWTCSAIYLITGCVTAGTTRLPSALFGMLGVLFTFLIGKRLFSEQAGIFGAAMLATSTQYFRMSHFAMMDVALAAMITGAFYFYLRRSTAGFLIFTILAFYAKGLLGVILAGLVVTLHLLIERKPKKLAATIAIGAVFFAVLVGPWFWELWKEGGRRYLEIFFIDNHWKRFFSKSADHAEHFWFYYFLSFPGDLLPWTLFFLAHLKDFFSNPNRYIRSSSFRFLYLWFVGMFLFFSLSSGKRSIYLLPALPAAALLCGAWLDDVVKKGAVSYSSKVALGGTVILSILLALAVPIGSVYAGAGLGKTGFSILVLAPFLVAAVTALQNKNTEKSAVLAIGLVVVSIGLSSMSFASYLDRDKSFEPFCRVVEKDLNGGVLVGYDMSEMERGVFGFYLGGPIRNPVGPLNLKSALDEFGSRKVCLILNRNKLDEVKSVLQGRTSLLYEYRPGMRSRSYLLYSTDVPVER